MHDEPHQSKLNSSFSSEDHIGLEELDWTFRDSNTQEYTHGLHNYPARMVPQIVRSLLQYYKGIGIIQAEDLVYDPFIGSGTTAVEARLQGLHSEGNDINPFAVMLSKAKAIPLDRGTLSSARESLIDGLETELQEIRDEYETTGRVASVEKPEVLDGWFPEPQLHELGHLRDRIGIIGDEYGTSYARFFRIILSHTTRKVSYQRNGEFKRYRIPEEKREQHSPDVKSIFSEKLEENCRLMTQYSELVDHSLETIIHYSDSRTAVDVVGQDVADIVVTSPPYGDHSTTVAYGQFSRDPAILTGEVEYEEMKDVDKTGLGGSKQIIDHISNLEQYSPALSATLSTLREKNGRADDALNFFSDYYTVMDQVGKITKSNQPVAWVVANRTMSRVNIPTHLITRELCEHLGYEFEINLPREIPNKTLPWKNAPENVEGYKGDLMANENIVVLRAP